MKKGILAALALSLALPACALGEAGYTAGTYSAETQGMESAVKVTVTVSDSAITDLTIDVSGETAGLGTEVGEPLKAAILEAQSADVDGVAGATVSSTAVKTAVKACLDEASGAAAWDGKFTAGTYTASATGKNGPVTVEVTFSEDAMTAIQVTDHTETYGLGYGVSTAPIDLLPGVILTAQSIDVDGVSSATVTSSNAIKAAVADCIAQAGGDAQALKSVAEKEPVQDAVYDVDVVVVGAGARVFRRKYRAGSGRERADSGKTGVTGGSTARAAAFSAQVPLATAQGFTDTPDMMYDYLMSFDRDGIMDADLVRTFCDNSAENIQWLVDRGVQMQDDRADSQLPDPVARPQRQGWRRPDQRPRRPVRRPADQPLRGQRRQDSL
ncbi:MAG: FMN-binding protein [Christensenellales bacterium]